MQGSRKRPYDKTIEGGRLRELLAESLAYVVGYQLYCSNNMIGFFIPYSKCTGQPTIVAKFDQDVNVFIKVLTKSSITRAKIQRRRQVGNSQKWSWSLTGERSLTRAFYYRV